MSSSWLMKGGTMILRPLSSSAGLKTVRGRLALHGRFRLDDAARDFLRKLRVQRFGFMVFDQDCHSVAKEHPALAEYVRGQLDLIEGFHVHEDEHVAGLVEELLFLLVQTDPFHPVRAPEPFVEFRTVPKIPQFDLRECAALSGLDVLDLDRRPETAIVIENKAGANFVSVDFRHFVSGNNWICLVDAHIPKVRAGQGTKNAEGIRDMQIAHTIHAENAILKEAKIVHILWNTDMAKTKAA